MNIEIRKLSPDDWQIYKDLRLQMLREEPQAYSQKYEDLIKRTDEEWKENTLTDTRGELVAFVDGKPAGMNGYAYDNPNLVFIWGMFIRKEYRGLGLGRMLMEEIEKEIRKDAEVKKIHVSVISSQITAWKLYEKLGYKEIKREKEKVNYDGVLYDEILMEKE